MFNSGIIKYNICQLCFKQLVKPNQLNCRNCQVKATNNMNSSSNVFKMKYSKKPSSLISVVDVTRQYIESKYRSKNLNDKKSISLIQYTHKADNIYNYEWSNFKKIEQLGNFIVYSNKIQIAEFIYRLRDDLKSVPRIQSFIIDHIKQYEQVYKPNTQCLSVIARPLLLVLNENFWTSLIESYFIYYHPQCTLFSLVDFDPKTAPESLISAIYFAGFLMQPGHHAEVASYMGTYAICNVKKIFFTVKLSSVQALGIYANAFYLNGNPSLSRVCLYHLFRIGHAMGISINHKNISALDQYNRKIVYSEMLVYGNWTKLGSSTYNTSFEDDEANLDTYDPKYQLQSSSLNLHKNDHERIIYSIFCTEFRKNTNQCIIVNNIICNYGFNIIEMEINELSIKTNDVYNNSKSCLESMVNLYPDYKRILGHYLTLIKIPFIAGSLGIYGKMIKSPKNINFVTIEAIINKCKKLWEIFYNNKILIHIWSFSPFTAAFYLIKVYPHSTKKQRKTVLTILRSIVDFYYSEGLNTNSMNFIILKTQLDLYNNK